MQRPLGLAGFALALACGCSPNADVDGVDDSKPQDQLIDTSTAVDDAVVVSFSPPSAIACGESAQMELVMRNTGTTQWFYNDYRLGAVGDSDPFYGPEPRVLLPEGGVVPPDSAWSFQIQLTAPEEPGSYTTDWQMVHEQVGWFGERVSAEITVACDEPTGQWVSEACARNGSEICDDESFGVDGGVRYGLLCSEATGGISFISSNTGPEMSDGVSRCQGWEEAGQDAWDHLAYVAETECTVEGDVLEVDLSAYAGSDLWFGSHDHPDGGGHMTSTCLVRWEE